jgi:hypothetical protein
MLHAFARNKSRAYRRYLGVRDPSEPRVSAEDEITSLIFGPLEFLSALDNWVLWKLVLQSPALISSCGPLPSSFFADFSPASCTFEFWPRKDNIEPDMVVQFADDTGATRSLLIELKWDAGVSGVDQLEKQWMRYQESEHDRSLHIFIAKRTGGLVSDTIPWACLEADGAVRLRAIRWHEFKHEIAKLSHASTVSVALRRWAVLVSDFLGYLEIRPFVGFRAVMHLAEAIPHMDGQDIVLWRHGAK